MFSKSEGKNKKKKKPTNLFLSVSFALKPNDFPAKPHKTEQAKHRNSFICRKQNYPCKYFKNYAEFTLLRRLRKLRKRSLYKNNNQLFEKHTKKPQKKKQKSCSIFIKKNKNKNQKNKNGIRIIQR